MEMTIYDVAKLAGVSTATVSRVINDQGNVSGRTEEKVRLAMEQLHYSPNALAQGFASNKSKTIGLIMNLGTDLPDYEKLDLVLTFFFTELFRGVNSVLNKKGYYLMIINRNNDFPRIVEDLLDKKRIDGLIIGFMPPGEEELKKAVSKERPLVYIGNIPGYKKGLHVYAQYLEYLDSVLEYFKSMGHESVCFLSNRGKEYLENGWNGLGRSGYEGIDITYIKNNLDQKSMIGEVKRIFTCDHVPTAIFVENIGAIQPVMSILYELGLCVPDDVSIISVEHIKGMGENYFPKLTNVFVPVYEMGRRAIEMLLEYIDGTSESYDCKVDLESRLIERDSVRSLKS